MIRGKVLVAGAEGFEQARRPWNRAVEQPVRAVVEAADAEDVATLIRYARLAGLTVTTQPSGHGASGNAADLILLRTGHLDELHIDPNTRVARAGAGVSWGGVLQAASPYGLTGLAGSSPAVTVTGYTLGGGLSWFSRKHGFASSSVRAFEVVDAVGARARVTAESDPELFWALRGGGGDFAVVTAVEFDLHPAPALYGGRVVWSGERAREVFEVFREITFDAPDELSVWFNRVRLPQAPPLVTLDVTYLGEEGDGRALLARLDKIGDALSDSRGPVAVADLGAVTAEPTDPAPARSRAELLTGLDDAVAEILLDTPAEPVVGIQLRHLGGALAAARPDGGPSGPVAEPYLLSTFGLALNPELSAAVGARQRRYAEELGERVGGRKPYTMLAAGERAAAAFTGPDLDRLRAIKRARDPHGVIRANFPVLS
ncbi:FAD-binding oxidoreductase [Nonomuraea maheshkhaliensis]|uniref:FAD-binding oxidoreductase n=1 Tax=Nonomuraea maheshkhaliensis TaxID=419590 RepID=A0ABN2ESP1_9ACTN